MHFLTFLLKTVKKKFLRGETKRPRRAKVLKAIIKMRNKYFLFLIDQQTFYKPLTNGLSRYLEVQKKKGEDEPSISLHIKAAQHQRKKHHPCEEG